MTSTPKYALIQEKDIIAVPLVEMIPKEYGNKFILDLITYVCK